MPLGSSRQEERPVSNRLWIHPSSGRAPCHGASHRVEEVATPDSGDAPGEMRLEQVGAWLVHNFSGMNESRDSRSSIRIAPARSIPLRTKSKPRLRNGRTLLLRPGRTASPYF